jgi:membrane-associated phospholipid phosphatase
MFPKHDLHLRLTDGYLSYMRNVRYHDIFYKCITELGAWVPFAVAGVLLLWRVRNGLYVLLAEGVTALMVYPMKQFFDRERPKLYFEAFDGVQLHFVDGVSVHSFHSFPSGHTATAFCAMLCFAVLCRKRPWLSAVFFALSALTGYSRIYLSQHFTEDVLAGSIVGVIAALVCTLPYLRCKQSWLDFSVIKSLRGK